MSYRYIVYSMEKNVYAKLVRQLAELDGEIERVRHLERSRAIAEIRSQMREYGIKPSELVGRKRGRSPAPARYLNPETGETWTGRGPRPHWLEGKKSKEFLIFRQDCSLTVINKQTKASAAGHGGDRVFDSPAGPQLASS